jgi:hypothetical protein
LILDKELTVLSYLLKLESSDEIDAREEIKDDNDSNEEEVDGNEIAKEW